jgi:hypothetical protein
VSLPRGDFEWGVEPPGEVAPPRDSSIAEWDAYLVRRDQHADRIVRRRISLLARLLHEALRPDAAALARRARQAEARLPPSVLTRARETLLSGRADAADVSSAAPVLLADADLLPRAARPAVIHAVAEAARLRLSRRRVPGSRWANDWGCGFEPELEPGEKDELGLGLCGMGHVAPLSRRFLDFLTTAEPS